MKLLGWMPRKLRLSEPLKDCVIGKPRLDDQHHYTKSCCVSNSLDKKQGDYPLQGPFCNTHAATTEEEKDFAEESINHFHGFLAIGTLGSNTLIKDPPTPALAITVGNTPVQATKLTENDLKLIIDQLGIVLGGDGNDSNEEGNYDIPGRKRHNGPSTSSQASTTQLGSKQTDATDSISSTRAPTCPLKGYLLSTGVELPETALVKKEHRPSLRELLQTARMEEGDSVAKCKGRETKKEKETHKWIKHLTEKMPKKIKNRASCWSSNNQTGGKESASKEKRLYQILNMLHKKVHPEYTTARPKSDEPQKYDIRHRTTCQRRNHGGVQMPPNENIMIPEISSSGDNLRNLKSPSNLPKVSNRNREYWIKTDADYLVLELEGRKDLF